MIRRRIHRETLPVMIRRKTHRIILPAMIRRKTTTSRTMISRLTMAADTEITAITSRLFLKAKFRSQNSRTRKFRLQTFRAI